jgi:Tfp pilus assembly protein PilV
MWRNKNARMREAFALYEVLIGVGIFTAGILSLGWSIQNCLNASALGAEDDRVRQILSDRMAEVQATPGFPDAKKETKVATGYGEVVVVQRSVPATLRADAYTELNGINLVTLTAEWKRNGVAQSRKIQFYVYRSG